MKKIKYLVFLILVPLLAACSMKKEAIDEEQFIKIMKSEGFEVVNLEHQYEQYEYYEEVLVAKNENYQIEFYELEDASYAEKIYNKNKQTIESSIEGSYSNTNSDLINNNKYTLTNKGVYTSISRVDDTIIYLSVSSEYKDEVKDILKKLGY